MKKVAAHILALVMQGALVPLFIIVFLLGFVFGLLTGIWRIA